MSSHLKYRAAIHVADANFGQRPTIEYSDEHDSYTIDIRPKGPKHARFTMSTSVFELLLVKYQEVKKRKRKEKK